MLKNFTKTFYFNKVKEAVLSRANFSKESQKKLENYQEKIILDAAVLECSDEDKASTYYFNNLIHSDLKEKLTCAKWNLHKQEPTSELLENFDASRDDVEVCKEPFYESSLKRLFMNEDITFLQRHCDWFRGINELRNYMSKGIIIKYDGEVSAKLKEVEMGKLKKALKNIVISSANCDLKHFDISGKIF